MKALAGLFVGIFISLIIAAFAGENPFQLLAVLAKSGLGSGYDIGWTLFYSTAFIFTGLSVFLVFQSGLFNVGAEGQLYLGAMGITAFALLFPGLSSPQSWILAIAFGALMAASSGALVGWLKTKRKSHEVITTIMMNFISTALVSYLTLGYFKNLESQNPESAEVSAAYRWESGFFQNFFPDTPLNSSFLVAIALTIFIYFVLKFTSFGFRLRVLGQNESAARSYGYPVDKIRILCFMMGAALTVGVGINEILGASGKLKLGFSVDYGFIGIAVAMLARSNALLVIPAAVLFGFLHKGSLDLDMESAVVTRDFARVLQALIILSVVIVPNIPDKKINTWVQYLRSLVSSLKNRARGA